MSVCCIDTLSCLTATIATGTPARLHHRRRHATAERPRSVSPALLLPSVERSLCSNYAPSLQLAARVLESTTLRGMPLQVTAAG